VRRALEGDGDRGGGAGDGAGQAADDGLAGDGAVFVVVAEVGVEVAGEPVLGVVRQHLQAAARRGAVFASGSMLLAGQLGGNRLAGGAGGQALAGAGDRGLLAARLGAVRCYGVRRRRRAPITSICVAIPFDRWPLLEMHNGGYACGLPR